MIKNLCLITQLLVGLWGLVNNAGIWYVSELEMTSEKVFRDVLEVNLMGMINMTKTFLPLIRKAQGRIVNMSSVTGENNNIIQNRLFTKVSL